MKLGLVLLTVGIHFTIVTCQEGDHRQYYSTQRKCSPQHIDMRTSVMDLYRRLNELCGITSTTTTATTCTTTTTTTAPCSAAPPLGNNLVNYVIVNRLTESPTFPAVTLYQLYNKALNDHFYTNTSIEAGTAEKIGYTLLTSPGRISLKQDCPCGSKLEPVYRMYRSPDHFYTPNKTEAIAATKIGYVDEGISWYCSAKPGLCGATLPLYRFINNGDHIYVTDLLQGSGSTYEGIIACYIWPS